jgi:hypothetical protein
MEQATKKKILIGGSVVVILGVAGYFAYRYFKNKKEEEKKKAEELAAAAAAASAAATASSGTSSGSSSGVSSPLGSSADILAFQKYANSKGAKLTEDGKWGPKSQTAWNTYGAEWQKSTTTNPVLEDAIKHLVSKGLSESGLRSMGADYVIAWANANKSGQSTFVLAGKYYDAKTGNQTSASGESAIGKIAYPKGAYVNVRSSASAASGAFDNTFIGQINSPNAVGKIKNLTFGADKFRWYEVDLLTPLAASTTGLTGLNPYAKTGWVREDNVTIK